MQLQILSIKNKNLLNIYMSYTNDTAYIYGDSVLFLKLECQ